MLPHPSPEHHAPAEPVPIGVGIDTSRYGHYAAFLDADLHQAAAELEVVESAAGYQKLRDRFEHLVRKHGAVHFHVRLDVAGAYADNLLVWLHDLAIDDAQFTLSTGDPQRNKNYRLGIYGPKKSDPVEARACAHFAITQKPAPMPAVSEERQRLRHAALRLQAVVRQRTRLVNQLHQLLARTFPELAMLVGDVAAGWVLELVHRYPTARVLAAATSGDLEAVPYLPHERVEPLLGAAQASIGSLHGELADELLRDQVRQVRDCTARQKRLESLLAGAYRDLAEPNYLDTIKGFGEVTAAILTAFIADIDRVHTPGQLVNYFGVLPIEASSGVDRQGNPRGPKRYVMSRRGNDLVRRYLWMAALSASRFNPACRALYARVRAKHPDRPAVAIGHVMRKLLHLAFAVWKTGKPFDPNHYPWQTPAHVERTSELSDVSRRVEVPAAGLKLDEPARSEVTATGEASLPQAGVAVWLDFAHLKRQLPMSRLLDQLGLTPRLKGPAAQKRCACPIHRGDGRGRTFSVNLESNQYQCFDARCGSQGDVIDLWAAMHKLDLRDAALDLVRTFELEPAPADGSEKRNG